MVSTHRQRGPTVYTLDHTIRTAGSTISSILLALPGSGVLYYTY